ncbi:MAG: hypothetical protein K6E75_13005, partial [Lachnospiraceae bacterium]|nr:hypothetical protein [Lachnospiraceae bacterium]
MKKQNKGGWNILILFLIIYLILRFCQVTARGQETGFLPGGAWQLDTGKEIRADILFNECEIEDETISAQGKGMDEISFPSSYDPRDVGMVSDVRDQGRFALCWNYAAVAAAESALIKEGYDNSIDLSEYHGAAITYQRQKAAGVLSEDMSFEDFCNDGGSPSYIWLLWQEGYGPGMEKDYPSVHSISENTVPADIDKGRIKSLSSVRRVEGNVDEIKREISQNGAVVGLYYSYGLYYNDGVNDKKDSSYYMPYPVKSKNHAISIVGWDDDFPAESFEKDFVRTKDGENEKDMPLPDGAWLIKNSWGERAYKSPDEGSGYYWISYYDRSLSDFTAISFEEDETGDLEDELEEDPEEDLEDDPETDEADIDEPDTDETDIDESVVEMPDDPDGKEIEENRSFEQERDAYSQTDEKDEDLSAGSAKMKKEKKLREKSIKIKGITYRIKGGRAAVKKVTSKRRTVKIPAAIRYQG